MGPDSLFVSVKDHSCYFLEHVTSSYPASDLRPLLRVSDQPLSLQFKAVAVLTK